MLERETYLTRASEARAAADEAKLDNVRQQCLRAEEAWLSMARRIERLNAMQAKNEEEKMRLKAEVGL